MGIAVGCVGMSLEDFERCTPFEFYSITEQWEQEKERRMQDDWERARFQAAVSIQPYSKKPIKPTDIIKFPWEQRKKKSTAQRGSIGKMKQLEKLMKEKGKL